MQTIYMNETAVQTVKPEAKPRKRKFNLIKGLKLLFADISEYFDLEATSDKVWFYGMMSIFSIAGLIALVARIQLMFL